MLRCRIFADQRILLIHLHFLSISNKGLALATFIPRWRPTISGDVTGLAATETGDSAIPSPATAATTFVPTLPIGVFSLSRWRTSPMTRIRD